MDKLIGGITRKLSLSGTVENKPKIIGQIQPKNSSINGTVAVNKKVIGRVNAKGEVSGIIHIPYNASEIYTGDYIVTPKIIQSKLPTANKLMIDDVTVRKIPYQETTNPSGGKTVIIGQEE